MSRAMCLTYASASSMGLITRETPRKQVAASWTAASALAEAAGGNGAGAIVTSSVEQSNVDIATQFSQMIVAQQAYSANAKMVTTASDMMQVTLDMKH